MTFQKLYLKCVVYEKNTQEFQYRSHRTADPWIEGLRSTSIFVRHPYEIVLYSGHVWNGLILFCLNRFFYTLLHSVKVPTQVFKCYASYTLYWNTKIFEKNKKREKEKPIIIHASIFSWLRLYIIIFQLLKNPSLKLITNTNAYMIW